MASNGTDRLVHPITVGLRPQHYSLVDTLRKGLNELLSRRLCPKLSLLQGGNLGVSSSACQLLY